MSHPPQQPGQPWRNPVPPRRRKAKRKALWIAVGASVAVLLAVVLIVAIPGASGVDRDDPDEVIAAFVAKVKERDVAGAMALVCSGLASPNFIHEQVTEWGGAELTLGPTSRGLADSVGVEITAVNGRPMNGEVRADNPGNLMTVDEETGFCIDHFIIADPLPTET